MHFKHPYYGDWLLNIQRPVRYIGNEHGQIKKPWDSASSKIALAFPDLYEIGMSHLGLRLLYQVLNSQPDILCERVFMPWFDMEEAIRQRSIPLVSLENAKPLSEFDILGFSLQYELSYTNCLAMLDLSGIPLRADGRKDPNPLIIGGGPIACHPEPMAPFFDLFFLGEAEELLPEILRKESSWRREGISREERLKRFSRLEPCYVPALHQAFEIDGRRVVGKDDDEPAAQKAWIENLSEQPDGGCGPVPAVEAVFDRISLEVMRGCTQGCRFCQAGMIYRPIRERSPLNTAETLKAAIERTGWDEASLTALSPADHSSLAELFRQSAQAAQERNVSISISSIRAYGLEDSLLDDLRTGRGGGLTFAPEAGTQKMRNLVNKNITTGDLLETIEKVAQRGWSRIKLYFMIGLPEETDEDIEAIVSLGKKAAKAARRGAKGKAPRITCAVSTFVPKPHTPLQWAPMISKEEILRRHTLLRRAAGGANIGLRFHPAETTYLEAILCRGDRRLAPVIEEAFALGSRFDSWEEKLDPDLWHRTLDKHEIDPNAYLNGYPLDSRLPWDHLDMCISKKFLQREFRRAMSFEPTPPCGVLNKKSESIICHNCGINCGLEDMKKKALATPVTNGSPTSKGADSLAIAATTHINKTPPQIVSTNDDCTKPLGTEPSTSYRISYLQNGPATLWGHLSLIRHIPRSLRRAGLELQYSQGFHPKPRIIYAPPLPMGWKGLNEGADIKLENPPAISDEDLIKNLETACPTGLRITEIVHLPRKTPSISKSVRGMDVIFDVRTKNPHSEEKIRNRVARFWETPEILQEVQTKKKTKTIDLKTLASHIEFETLEEETGLGKKTRQDERKDEKEDNLCTRNDNHCDKEKVGEKAHPTDLDRDKHSSWRLRIQSPSTSGSRVGMIPRWIFSDIDYIEASRRLIIKTP